MARLFFSPDSDPVSHHTIPSLGKRAEKANLAAGVRTPDPLPLGVSWGNSVLRYTCITEESDPEVRVNFGP